MYFFKRGGKVTRLWHLLFHRIWTGKNVWHSIGKSLNTSSYFNLQVPIYKSWVTCEKVMVMLYGPTRRFWRRRRREKNPWKITQNLNNLKFKFWMVNVSRHHHSRDRGNWIQHHISLLCMTSSKSEAIYHITIIHIVFISIYFSNGRHGMMVIFNSRILNKIISIFVWILIKQAFIYTYT